MQLVTPREAFLHHLQLAASVCPTRSPRPILQDVLIEAGKGSVTMLATDGEVSLRTSYESDDIKGEGKAALPAVTLLSAVRSMSDDTVTIEEKASLHQISCGTAVFKLNGDEPEMFPSIPTVDTSTVITLPLGDFLGLCERTMFAAAKEMGRYAFNGVLFEVDPDEITMVATDGRRMALSKLAGSTDVGKRQSRILPVKGLQQLQRAATEAGTDATLKIGLLENQVAFGLPHSEIVAQLVEGEFPDFRAVLPKETDAPQKVNLNREELAGAIRRAAVTAGEGARSVELNFGSGKLQVSSRQEGVGEARSEMEVEYDGDSVGIRFNPEFLGDYLKVLPEEAVDFRFKDRASAGFFTSETNSVYVVMPITS
jgi:DNA polymerase-3 subunit beta